MGKSSNVVWHNATVTRARREDLNGHKGAVFWFTGLSGAGKSSIAHAVEEKLFQNGIRTVVLDGDNVRHGLCGDLGFSDLDRKENIRRISHLAKLFSDNGLVIMTAFISPFRADRDNARKVIGADFHEIFCDSSVTACEERDVKGLYRRARAGEIPEFTGISSPYEEPEDPELKINTEKDFDDSMQLAFDYVFKAIQLDNEKL